MTTPEKKLAQLEAALEVQETMRAAVRKAQEESRQKGVPLSFSINGQTYFELPGGELTRENPWKKPASDAEQG
jgi:hypothetical protein